MNKNENPEVEEQESTLSPKESSFYKRWQERIGHWQGILILIAGTVTLVISLWPSDSTSANSDIINGNINIIKGDNKEDDGLKDLQEIAERISGNFNIGYFKKSRNTNVFEFGGKYTGPSSLFKAKQLHLFINDGNLFFPCIGSVSLLGKKWFHNNVFIGIEGDFMLIVAISEETISETLNQRNSDTNGRGFNGLPKGLHIISTLDFRKEGDQIIVNNFN